MAQTEFQKTKQGKLFCSSNVVQEQKLFTTLMGSFSSEKDIKEVEQATLLNVILVEDSKMGQERTSGNGILADIVH